MFSFSMLYMNVGRRMLNCGSLKNSRKSCISSGVLWMNVMYIV